MSGPDIPDVAAEVRAYLTAPDDAVNYLRALPPRDAAETATLLALGREAMRRLAQTVVQTESSGEDSVCLLTVRAWALAVAVTLGDLAQQLPAMPHPDDGMAWLRERYADPAAAHRDGIDVLVNDVLI
jgi:hypothetical protein